MGLYTQSLKFFIIKTLKQAETRQWTQTGVITLEKRKKTDRDAERCTYGTMNITRLRTVSSSNLLLTMIIMIIQVHIL